jgi:hypothetical protein
MKTVKSVDELNRLAFSTGARVSLGGRTVNRDAEVRPVLRPEAEPPPPPPPPPPEPPVNPMLELAQAVRQLVTQHQQTELQRQVENAKWESLSRDARALPALPMVEPVTLRGPGEPKRYSMRVERDRATELATRIVLVCNGSDEWSFVPHRNEDGLIDEVEIEPYLGIN